LTHHCRKSQKYIEYLNQYLWCLLLF